MTSSKSHSPATEALSKAMDSATMPVVTRQKPMINSSAMKRSRTSLDSFDMSDFEVPSKQVEDSIVFPTIEWSFADNDDEDEIPPPSKRMCRGLARSAGSCDLFSLSHERNGSFGSLCWPLYNTGGTLYITIPPTVLPKDWETTQCERRSFAFCATCP